MRTITISALANFMIVFVTCMAAARYVLNWKKVDFWLGFFGFQIFLLISLFILNSQAVDIGNARYFVFLPYIFGILLAYFLGKDASKPTRLIMLALIVFSLFITPARAVKQMLGHSSNPNIRTYELEKTLESRGLDKGYSDFWNAHTTSYFSNYNLTVVPLNCPNDKLEPYYWLVSNAMISQESKESFYISDANQGSTAACQAEHILKQFGQPSEVIEADSHTKVYVFPYDISERMQKR
jgi:hypothetical protein